MKTRLFIKLVVTFLIVFSIAACAKEKPAVPLRTVAELDIGQTKEIRLTNGEIVQLTLLGIEEKRSDVRNIISDVTLRVQVNEKEVLLSCGTYNLPLRVGKVKIDCTAAKNYLTNSMRDHWKLKKDARFRLWPDDSPYLKEGTFCYPVKQRWMADFTHSGNEPSLRGWGVRYDWEKIYYHEGHDIGGADGMDEIISATDGRVISIRNEAIEGYDDFQMLKREDRLVVVDDRNWLYMYSHLHSTNLSIQPGDKVKKGQSLGLMGKKGGSGGIVHLHFGMFFKDKKTNEWIVEDAYPYLWEAYQNEYDPKLKAIARPLKVLFAGQTAILDASKSIGVEKPIEEYEWIFGDGSSAKGAIQNKRYDRPGFYSEILKVTDSKGNIDYDFAPVLVYNREHPEETDIGLLHLACHPTLNVKAGDELTFLVRVFHSRAVDVIVDFGDGTKPVKTTTKGITKKNHSGGDYAKIKHSFSKSGDYVVTAKCSEESGLNSVNHVHVVIE